jgi:hypothetical protein
VVTFTVLVTNSVNALANAYDLVVQDVVVQQPVRHQHAQRDRGGAGVGRGHQSVRRRVTLVFSSDTNTALVPGQRVTNIFSVALAQTLRPNQSFTNRAQLTASDTIYGTGATGIPIAITTPPATCA